MTWPWMVVMLALVGAVIGLSLLVVGLITRVEPILARAEKLLDPQLTLRPIAGTQLPNVELRDGDGVGIRSIEWLGHPRLLLFATATCPPCTELLDDVRSNGDAAPDIPIALVTDENSARVLRDGTLPSWLSILHEDDYGLSEGLGVDRTPLAVLVDQHNRVRHTAVPGSVDDLLEPTGRSTAQVLAGS